MSQSSNPRKSYPHVPKQSYDRQPMHYICIGADDIYTMITRAEFFSLMRSVDEPIKQTYIDADGGCSFFFPLSAHMAEFAVRLKREKDAEDQRRVRTRQCIYKNTAKCDGWRTRDEYGCLGCETCSRDHIHRTVSLNQPVGEDGTEMGDLLADDTSIERDMEETATRDLIAATLASLPEDDRTFILRRFQDGMTLRKLADECDISDFRYAGKKANRIIERLKAEARRLAPQ
jgi:DNA-directed RNA polymerase specialized sigma24 family protein